VAKFLLDDGAYVCKFEKNWARNVERGMLTTPILVSYSDLERCRLPNKLHCGGWGIGLRYFFIRLILFLFLFLLFFFCFLFSLAAYMRQVPDFLIGLRNKTARKRVSSEIYSSTSKLQARTCDENHHTKPQSNRVATRPRSPTACAGKLAPRRKAWVGAGGRGEDAGRTRRGLCDHSQQKVALVIAKDERMISTADSFFIFFFVALANPFGGIAK
jgi:hypothetical protein